MNNSLCQKLFKVLDDLNIWGLEIKRDDPAIVIEGPREKLLWLFGDLIKWDQEYDYKEHTINQFEIAMDLEDNYISFFLKPENYA